MTKADIVNEISKSTGVEKAAVLETVEKFMEVVKDSLANGENVYLRGFVLKKLQETFPRIRQSSFRSTKSRLSNRQKCLWKRLNNNI